MPGSISLKAQHKVFVKEMKEKSVTFCFLKLKVKEIENISKIIGKGCFSVENLGLFFQS